MVTLTREVSATSASTPRMYTKVKHAVCVCFCFLSFPASASFILLLFVFEASAWLEKRGCSFQKKPDEGRMKGLAFVLDPDGYRCELVARSEKSKFPVEDKFNLSQTMLRVKDPKISITFYQNYFNMKLLRSSHFSDFSLFFLATPSEFVTDEATDKLETDTARDFVCFFLMV